MKARRFKILLLADSRAFHTERIVGELRRQGCQVLTASLEKGSIHHFHLKSRGPIRKLHYAFSSLQVRRLIERFRPDVINAHYACGYGFVASQATRKGQVPIVLNLWGSDVLIVPHWSTLHRLKTVRGLAAACHVTGDSEYLVESARKLTPLNETSVIPWGVERRFLQESSCSSKVHKPLRIITPRTQAKIYNNDFILDTLEPMVREGKITLTFPAFGALAKEFRSKVRRLPASGVTLYEKMPRDEYMEMVRSHDVYLSASRSDSSPASLIEAMGLGLVPIAAEIDGVREWLDLSSGITFPQDDAESLTNAVAKLLRSYESFDQIRKDNFARVQEEAVFEDNVAELLGIMRKAAGKDR